MKVTFPNEDTLNKVITDRFKIFQQRLIMDPYKPKPKVIKCHRCQRFGHISRLCRSEKPKCGKCSSENHETTDCVVQPENYKCAHCNLNHITGHKECQIMKNKETEIANNFRPA